MPNADKNAGYVTEKSGKRRRALSVSCHVCGTQFMKRLDHALRDTDHFCSLDCHNSHQKSVVMEGGSKYCRSCKTYRTPDMFYKRSGTTGIRSTCRQCTETRRQSNTLNLKIIGMGTNTRKYNKSSTLKASYGITSDDYNILVTKQGGVCAICGLHETVVRHGKLVDLSVDHCHSSGMVRGLLCIKCNAGIGLLGDTSLVVKKAVMYLEYHESK